MSERVRQAELARRLQVSRQAVNDLVSRGILNIGEDGLIDVDAARIAIANNVHPAGKTAAAARPQQEDTPSPSPAAQTAGLDYHTARTLREYTEAQRSALKLRQEIGEVAPVAEMEMVLSAIGSKVGKILDTIPGLVRRRVPGISSDVIEAIEDDIAKCRNMAASMTLASLNADDESDDIEVET